MADADLEIERLKISIEEKRLAAELTRLEIEKSANWAHNVETDYKAKRAGEMFKTLLACVREQK